MHALAGAPPPCPSVALQVDILGNSARSSGGGVYRACPATIPDLCGHVTIHQSSITNNTAGYTQHALLLGARGAATGSDGGGAFFAGPMNVTISNCSLLGNNAQQCGSGGAVAATGAGRVTLLASNFVGNTAGLHGGAVDVASSQSLEVRNVNISASTAAAGDGGSIHSTDVATVMILNVTLQQGSTGRAGGGIFVSSPSRPGIPGSPPATALLINGLYIAGNRAGERLQTSAPEASAQTCPDTPLPGGSGGGGAIAIEGPVAAILQSTTLQQNLAQHGGGALALYVPKPQCTPQVCFVLCVQGGTRCICTPVTWSCKGQ